MNQKHIDHIDGIRGIAVLAVILYHLFPKLLPGGFSGVDVFFVISGFVVSTSLARREPTSFKNYCLGFYSRRMIRIVPALIVCLLATAILSTLFIPRAWLSNFNEMTALYAFFGFSNVILAGADGYFAPRSEFNPFTHTWSLGVEEQFYLIFPFLFFLLNNLRQGSTKNSPGRWLFLALLFGSFAFAIFGETHSIYYSSLARFWELAAGVALAKATINSPHLFELTAKRQTYLQVFGSILILIGFIAADPKSFPFPWALLPVLGTMCLLCGLHTSKSAITAASVTRSFLSSSPMVYLGRISYSLYLWHWAVFVLFRWTVGLDSYIFQTAALAVTAILAELSYDFVEQPVRRSTTIANLAKLNPIRIVAGGLACVVVSSLLTNLLLSNQLLFSLSQTATQSKLWYTDITPKETGCHALTLNRDFTNGSSAEIFPDKCSPTRSEIHIFVLGDSHAASYTPLLTRLSASQGIAVSLYAQGGCEIFNMADPLENPNENCRNFLASALQDIFARAKESDVLFLPGLRSKRFVDQWALQPASALKAEAELHYSDAEKLTLARLRLSSFGLEEALAKKMRIVIETPKPVFKAPAFRCSDWFNSANPICQHGLTVERDLIAKAQRPVSEALARFSHTSSLISLWNPFATLCPNSRCDAVLGGSPLFFDGDHISRYANGLLYSSFEKVALKSY